MINSTSISQVYFSNQLLKVSKDKLYGITLGIIVYVQTLAFVPHTVSLLSLLIVFVFRFEKILQFRFDGVINKNLFFLCLIIVAGTINRIYFIEKFEKESDFIPYFSLMLISFAIAMEVNIYFFQTLLFCTLIESIFVFYEYYHGVSTIFTSLDLYEVFPMDSSLLYNKRAMGLSENSSNVSEKIFLAFFFIDIIKPKKIFAWLIRVVLLLALYMTFNRTAIVALVIYAAFQLGLFLWKIIFLGKFFNKSVNRNQTVVLLLIFAGGIAWLIPRYKEQIISQFTRDKGYVELSGREIIWQHFGDFIESNFWFGNGSYKKYVPYDDHYDSDGTLTLAHAHNSFLELLASHGIFIFLLYMVMIFVNIRRDNWIFIFSILIYSLTQYAIFWGISYFDIIFFALLFNRKIFQKEFLK